MCTLLASYMSANKGVQPAYEEVYKGLKLGRWAARQRRLFGSRAEGLPLSTSQAKALTSISGWSWTPPLKWIWSRNYEILVRYVDAHNVLPNSVAIYEGVSIGIWTLRQRWTTTIHTNIQKNKLESIPVWSWTTAPKGVCMASRTSESRRRTIIKTAVWDFNFPRRSLRKRSKCGKITLARRKIYLARRSKLGAT